jgi:hypothetical protein
MGEVDAVKPGKPDSREGLLHLGRPVKQSFALFMLAVGDLGTVVNVQAWLAGATSSKGLAWALFGVCMAAAAVGCVVALKVGGKTGRAKAAASGSSRAKRRRASRAASIVGAIAVILALVAVSSAVYTFRTLLEQPVAGLTAPGGGLHVSSGNGFTVSGNVRNVGPDSVWITDYDGGFTVDGKALITGGTWSAFDNDLGTAAQKPPFPLTVVAVLANPSCAATLDRVSNSDNDYLTALPPGCSEVGHGKVTVEVTRR